MILKKRAADANQKLFRSSSSFLSRFQELSGKNNNPVDTELDSELTSNCNTHYRLILILVFRCKYTTRG